MWSGPRNLSTAMMYAFGSRDDFAAWDEPFYAAYLAETGLPHPMLEDILANDEVDPKKVAARCAGPIPEGKEEQYYQMWAEFQDKMVNIGVLDASERKLRPIPYMENAVALSITIENKNAAEKSEDNQVAEISLKNK